MRRLLKNFENRQSKSTRKYSIKQRKRSIGQTYKQRVAAEIASMEIYASHVKWSEEAIDGVVCCVGLLSNLWVVRPRPSGNFDLFVRRPCLDLNGDVIEGKFEDMPEKPLFGNLPKLNCQALPYLLFLNHLSKSMQGA